MALRSKNSVVLFKIETTAGVENAPAVTDAVRIEGRPQINLNPNVIQTDESGGSLDGAGPIVGGMKPTFSITVNVKGSGAAGTAPEFGDMLRCSGYSETLTGTAIPAAPEACAAGGTTTLANLGVSAAATANLYRGMPLLLTGTVAGQTFISDYTAGKAATLTDTMSGAIAATTNYQIPANALYSPASSNIPTGTCYIYMDGLLYKFVGCRGNMQLSMTSGGIAQMTFNFYGMFISRTDAAVPAGTFDATRPVPFIGGKMLYNRLPVKTTQFSIDMNNGVVFPDDANQTYGVSEPDITERRITGTINPLAVTVATRDILTDVLAGTRRIVHARMGNTAGNRFGITIPNAQPTNETPDDRNGLMAQQVPFEATGQDAGAFLCFY